MAKQLRRDASFLTGGILLTALGYGVVRVHADGAPTKQPLWYAGTVADQTGAPLEGTHSVGVNLTLLAQGAGAPECSVPPTDAMFVAGRFRVDTSACAATVRAQPDLFTELSVDGKVFPRTKVGAVPYSLEAAHAVTATSAGAAAGATGALKTGLDALSAQTAALAAQVALLQRGLATGCPAGEALRAVDAQGVPVCGGANGVVAIQAALSGARDGGSQNASCPAGYTLLAAALAEDRRTQSGTSGWNNGGQVACLVNGNTLTVSLISYAAGTDNTYIVCYGICSR